MLQLQYVHWTAKNGHHIFAYMYIQHPKTLLLEILHIGLIHNILFKHGLVFDSCYGVQLTSRISRSRASGIVFEGSPAFHNVTCFKTRDVRSYVMSGQNFQRWFISILIKSRARAPHEQHLYCWSLSTA